MEAPTDLRLTYFNMPGRGEFIRLLFAYGNVPFEDSRISFQEWGAKKATLDLPFGQMPILQTHGKTYAQSLAIARYAAKLSGLYPADPLVALEADSLIDAILENWDVYNDNVYGNDDKDTKQQKHDNIGATTFPRLLANLEKRVKGPYFTGDKPTHADIYLFDFHQHALLEYPTLAKELATNYPKIAAIVERVHNSNELATYFKKA
ncbi:hypothetical protein AC1031_010863 [Aphanomyces cochlioides]|nr:hypothetical protein AC1031_010863 [Aphanomyces cochlioides]